MILIKVRESGLTPRGLKRQMPKFTKAGFLAAGDLWHGTFRPKHFTARGAREYGYDKRKGESLPRTSKAFWRSYTGRKLRTKGHTLPLVFSGLSKALTRMRDIRATPESVRVVLRSPGFNRRHKDSTINMRAELTRISIAERQVLTKQIDLTMQEKIDAVSDKHTKTFR